MKIISLTQGQFTQVDNGDFEWLSQWKWYADWQANTRSFSAKRKLPTVKGRRVALKMHRAILGAQPGQIIDHINHDTLNNQRSNLRVCSRFENAQNRRKQSNNTSGFIGVSWYTPDNVWVANITLNGKRVHLGYFKDKDEAVLVRDDAVRRLHGEFGVLNVICSAVKASVAERSTP